MGRKQSVLVIDDSPFFLQTTMHLLETAGYDAFSAETGAKGFKQAKEHCPDLILLDVMLPDTNGFDLCRQIKAEPGLSKSFVMLFSGIEDDSESQAEGLETGADGFIAKSVSDRELMARVKTMLRIKDTETQLSATLEQLWHKHEALLQAQERIKSSQKDYEELYDFAPVGYCTLNGQGIMLKANQTLIELLGIEKRGFVGSSFVQHIVKEDRARFYQHLHCVFSTRHPQHCEIRLRKRSGELIWSLLQSVLIRNAEETSYECRMAIADISARKQAEENLEKRSHDLTERVKELNCLFDLTRLMEMPGITAEEILQGTAELLPGAWQYPDFCCVRILLGDDIYVSREFTDTIWRLATSILVHNELCGQIEVFYLKRFSYGPEGPFMQEEEALLNAVAERLGKYFVRKRAEEALHASEERYKLLVETMDEGLATIDENGILTYMNQKFCEMVGADCHDLIGQDSLAVIAPKNREMHQQQFAIRKTGEAGNYETCLIRKDGRLLPVILGGSPLVDSKGLFKGALGVFTDISKLKLVEDALRESETRYRALFEDSPVSLWEADLSLLKNHLDVLRREGVHDYANYLDAHPEELRHCAGMIRLVDVNKAAVALYKAENKEHLLTTPNRLFSESSYRMFHAILLAFFEGKSALEIDTAHLTLTGETIYIRLKYSVAPDCAQCLSRVLVSVANLTERKRIEDKLAQERKLLHTLMDNSQDAIYFKDLDSRFIRLNNAWAKRARVENPVFAVGKTDFDFFDEEHAREAFEDEQKIIRSGVPLIAKEEKEAWPDDRHEWVSTTKMPLHNERGDVIGTFGISRDITRRKLSEERQNLATQILELLNKSGRKDETIREILHLLRQFTGFDALGIRLHDGQDFPYYECSGFPEEFIATENYLCAWDQNGELLRDSQGNPRLECMCGNVLCGRTDPALPFFTVGGSFWSNCTSKLLTSTSEEERQSLTRNHCNSEGYESVALVPLHSANRIIGLLQFNDTRENRFSPELIKFFEEIGVSIGIALENKQTEEEMTRLRNFMKNMIDSMPSVLVGIDRSGRVTHWNFEAERMTDLKSEEAQGRILEEVIPQLRSYMGHVQQAIQLREPQKAEKVNFQVHGETRHSNVMVYPLVDKDVEGAVVRVDDVTERVRFEEMMIQSEKMASVGGLAAGMAHELNNPLASILQNTQVVLNRLTKRIPANIQAARELGISVEAVNTYMARREIVTMLESIENSGERAAQIVADMLSFSRKGGSLSTLYDVRKILDRAVTLTVHIYDPLKNYDFRQVNIVREYDPDLPKIPCDQNQIQQVILNLLTNSAQALAELEKQSALDKVILRTIWEGSFARIEVEDNGPGMPEKIRKRVFEPFFTTKDVGVGTGLGLAVSYFIIKEHHGGTMSVESEPGTGTKFIIHLPLAESLDRLPKETP
ncbi:MAG: PAS domain S-box protein [bacterium]|nr:PAS domain S-box protein [bacterium]